MRKITYSIIAAIAVLIIAACGSSKKGAKPSYEAGGESATEIPYGGGGATINPEPARGKGAEKSALAAKAKSVAAAYGEWTELSVPVKVSLSSPKSISGSGRAYMRRGQDIYISIRLLGFEVATAYVDSDSVMIADKINRRYIAEPLSRILGNGNLTISDVQDILLGRVFVNQKGTLSAKIIKDVELKQEAGYWLIDPKKKVAGASYKFEMTDGETPSLRTLCVEAAGREVRCEYSDPKTTKAGSFMQKAAINAEAGSKKISATLKWDLGSAKYEVSSSIGWKTPKNYTKINVTNLLKGFKL